MLARQYSERSWCLKTMPSQSRDSSTICIYTFHHSDHVFFFPFWELKIKMNLGTLKSDSVHSCYSIKIRN